MPKWVPQARLFAEIRLQKIEERRDSEPAFAPFGKAVEGWDVVEKLYSGYGENSGSGMRAGHQDKIFEGGNAYVKSFLNWTASFAWRLFRTNRVAITP